MKKIAKNGPVRKRVRLLLGKFGTAEHEKYINFILLKQPGKVI